MHSCIYRKRLTKDLINSTTSFYEVCRLISSRLADFSIHSAEDSGSTPILLDPQQTATISCLPATDFQETGRNGISEKHRDSS